MARAQRREHRLQAIFQRQEMGRAAAGRQRQDDLAGQGFLVQEVEQGLQPAGKRSLVDGRGDDHHAGGRHPGAQGGCRRAGIAAFDQVLGRHVPQADLADLMSVARQRLGHMAQKRRGARARGRTACQGENGHGDVAAGPCPPKEAMASILAARPAGGKYFLGMSLCSPGGPLRGVQTRPRIFTETGAPRETEP
jgi:hypothetical protein